MRELRVSVFVRVWRREMDRLPALYKLARSSLTHDDDDDDCDYPRTEQNIERGIFFWGGGLFVVVLCYISMRSHYRGSERANTLQRLPMFRLASQALCNRKILKMDQTRPLFVCIRFSLDK